MCHKLQNDTNHDVSPYRKLKARNISNKTKQNHQNQTKTKSTIPARTRIVFTEYKRQREERRWSDSGLGCRWFHNDLHSFAPRLPQSVTSGPHQEVQKGMISEVFIPDELNEISRSTNKWHLKSDGISARPREACFPQGLCLGIDLGLQSNFFPMVNAFVNICCHADSLLLSNIWAHECPSRTGFLSGVSLLTQYFIFSTNSLEHFLFLFRIYPPVKFISIICRIINRYWGWGERRQTNKHAHAM